MLLHEKNTPGCRVRRIGATSTTIDGIFRIVFLGLLGVIALLLWRIK